MDRCPRAPARRGTTPIRPTGEVRPATRARNQVREPRRRETCAGRRGRAHANRARRKGRAAKRTAAGRTERTRNTDERNAPIPVPAPAENRGLDARATHLPQTAPTGSPLSQGEAPRPMTKHDISGGIMTFHDASRGLRSAGPDFRRKLPLPLAGYRMHTSRFGLCAVRLRQEREVGLATRAFVPLSSPPRRRGPSPASCRRWKAGRGSGGRRPSSFPPPSLAREGLPRTAIRGPGWEPLSRRDGRLPGLRPPLPQAEAAPHPALSRRERVFRGRVSLLSVMGTGATPVFTKAGGWGRCNATPPHGNVCMR